MRTQDQMKDLVLNQMPTFIAVNYKKILDATAVDERIRATLHVYELCVRSLSIGLISQYLIRDKDKVRDTFLDQVLLEKLPKGTLSTWIELLLLTLRVYVGNRDLFFIPELYDLYWDTSMSPHSPKNGLEENLNKLIKIKYDFEYGGKPNKIEELDSLCNIVLGLLDDLLQSLDFITNYELIRITRRKENYYSFEQHTGLTITYQSIELPEVIKLEVGWFYLGKERRDFLSLDPLLVFWEDSLVVNGVNESDIAVFERFTNNQLQYLLSRLGRVIENQNHISDFTRIVFETIRQIKRVSREIDKLTWWQLRDISAEFSDNHVATIQDKYNPRLYLQRDKTKKAFDDFLQSDKRCFVLLGKSGVGKSNFILSVKDEFALERKNTSMVILDAANIDTEKDLTDVITQGFSGYVDFVDHEMVNIWQEIARIDEIENKTVILCLDAINENPNPQKILKHANDLIQSRYTWLKIVITSRPESWINIKQGIKLAERYFYRESLSSKAAVEMEGFNYSQRLEPFTDSEIRRVYALYKEVFHLKTEYQFLSEDVKNSLRDPLVLWLISSIYQEKEMPLLLRDNEVISNYVKAMVSSSRLESKDIEFLENEIMPLMINQGYFLNSISSQSINQSNKSLFERINVDNVLSNGKQVNQSFVNLLDTEILVKKGDAWDYEIGFKYERFYDHFSARRLELLFSSGDFSTYEYLIGKMLESPFLWGAIKNMLLRNLRFELISNMAKSSNYFLRELIESVLIDYSVDNSEKVEGYLLQLYKTKNGKLITKQQVKNLAIDVASAIANENVLVMGCRDTDKNIRTSTYQQIYKFLQQGKSDLVLHIFDTMIDRASFSLNLNKLIGVLESLAVISLLILLNFADDENVIAELKKRWAPIMKKYPLLSSSSAGGPISTLGNFSRKIIFNFVASILFWQINRLEASKTAVFNIKDFNLSLKMSREQKMLVRKVLGYINGEGDILSYENHMREIANTRDVVGIYATGLSLLGGLTREREKTIPLILRISEHSLNLNPPSAMLSGMTLILMHTLSTNLGKFDGELLEVYRKILLGLLEKSRCVFTSQAVEYTWWTYELYTYYYNLHVSEDCPAETLRFIEVMEQDKKYEELHVFIDFMADYNMRLLFVESNVKLIFNFLNHKNSIIKKAAIQSITLLRSKYPLEIDGLIRELNISRTDRIAIENHIPSQDLGMILTVSGMSFWSKAIINNDVKIIGFFMWIANQVITSNDFKSITIGMVNELMAVVKE